MAYSVEWSSLIVTIPKNDLVLVSASPEVYSLDVNVFWENLHNIQDSFEAMGFPPIMQGLPPTSFSPRGVVLDPQSAGWRIELEDGQYEVRLVNGNSDVQSNRVQNQVSITSNVTTGASAGDFWSYLLEDSVSAQEFLRVILSATAGKGGPDGSGNFRYRDIADSKDRIVAVVDGQGSRASIALDGA